MIDYKLILILVLSIVLFFVYNKVEELREDINDLKKKNKEFSKEKNVYISSVKNNTSNELLELFKTQKLSVANKCEDSKCSIKPKINTNSNVEANIIKNNEITNNEITNNEITNNEITNNEITNNEITNNEITNSEKENKEDIFPIINENQNLNEAYYINRDNTESYNATEYSDSLDINYEKTTSAEKGYVTYSNDKDSNNVINLNLDENDIEYDDNNSNINIDTVLNDIKNKNDIFLKNSNEILINSSILHEKPSNELIDSSNSDKNLCDDLGNNLSDKKSETNSETESSDSVIKELDKIQILQDISGKIILKNKNINSETLDKEDSDESLNSEYVTDSIEGEINTSEFRKINLNSIYKYKLNDLQDLASKHKITILKDKNGKSVNKTKKELYSELLVYQEN